MDSFSHHVNNFHHAIVVIGVAGFRQRTFNLPAFWIEKSVCVCLYWSVYLLFPEPAEGTSFCHHFDESISTSTILCTTPLCPTTDTSTNFFQFFISELGTRKEYSEPPLNNNHFYQTVYSLFQSTIYSLVMFQWINITIMAMCHKNRHATISKVTKDNWCITVHRQLHNSIVIMIIYNHRH